MPPPHGLVQSCLAMVRWLDALALGATTIDIAELRAAINAVRDANNAPATP